MNIFFAIALSTLMISAASAQAPAAVQLQRLTIADPKGPPLEIGIWFPARDIPASPLILMSHGTGGDYRSHSDTAEALATSGFVVAAVTHTGDNWRDLSGSIRIWERPRHLKLLTNYMLAEWTGRARIDSGRIGAFGFSAGGFTALVAAGGVPDLSRIQDHCRAHPATFECQLLAAVPKAASMPKVEWTHDPRIKAAVIAAPALGYTFGSGGLKAARLPVQLWRAAEDEILPHPFYAEAVRTALPIEPEYRVVSNAGHFEFLSPCSSTIAKLRPEICTSRSGFDRRAFHIEFNAAVVRFFSQRLAALPLAD